MRHFSIVILLFVCFATYSQTISVNEYEKISDPYYPCSVYVLTINNNHKLLSIEHKFGSTEYTKEEAKQWIDGLEKLFTINVGKTDTGKREAILTVGEKDRTMITLLAKEAIISYDAKGAVAILPESLKKLHEAIKKAYEKL